MRIDPDHCRDPDLLAAEVRRLHAVISAGQPTLTDEEREAIQSVLHHIATRADYLQREDYHLRSLLERLGGSDG